MSSFPMPVLLGQVCEKQKGRGGGHGARSVLWTVGKGMSGMKEGLGSLSKQARGCWSSRWRWRRCRCGGLGCSKGEACRLRARCGCT